MEKLLRRFGFAPVLVSISVLQGCLSIDNDWSPWEGFDATIEARIINDSLYMRVRETGEASEADDGGIRKRNVLYIHEFFDRNGKPIQGKRLVFKHEMETVQIVRSNLFCFNVFEPDLITVFNLDGKMPGFKFGIKEKQLQYVDSGMAYYFYN